MCFPEEMIWETDVVVKPQGKIWDFDIRKKVEGKIELWNTKHSSHFPNTYDGQRITQSKTLNMFTWYRLQLSKKVFWHFFFCAPTNPFKRHCPSVHLPVKLEWKVLGNVWIQSKFILFTILDHRHCIHHQCQLSDVDRSDRAWYWKGLGHKARHML